MPAPIEPIDSVVKVDDQQPEQGTLERDKGRAPCTLTVNQMAAKSVPVDEE